MIQQATALRHQLEQAAAGVVVLLVGLEVLGEVGDPFGEDGHLDFGATRCRASERAWVVISSALRSAVIDIGCLRSGEVKDARGVEPPRPHLAERDDPAVP